MTIKISMPDNEYAHPLYVPNVKRSFIQYDPKTSTLYADYSEDDSVLERVYNGEMYEWNISNQILSSDLEVLLNLIKDGLENGTIDPLSIGHTLETGQHDTPELALIAEAADPYNDTGENGGIDDTQSAGNMDIWGDSQYPDMNSLLTATDDDIKEWIISNGYNQEDDYGDRHSISGDTTELGLLTAWRGKIEAYRREKETNKNRTETEEEKA